MAQLSGSEPISAENLAYVLGSGAIGGMVRLFSGSSGTATLSEDPSGFDMLMVVVRTRNGGSTIVNECFFAIPGESGQWNSDATSKFIKISGKNVTAGTGSGGERVRLVYGIRSGGGAALS